ncbi:zinc transporter ZIP4 [Brachionichthys hirsutus]|uniref:zinc transporter ZIP4 n=1 Tax=Brachionichthys hirsutus TaxID=412623 RepID=UPI003604E108
MFVPPALLLAVWGSLGAVSGSPAVEAVYGDVVGVVSPGEQRLTWASVRSLFNMLEQRVQCGGVPCGKCNLTGAVDQLIGPRVDGNGTGGEHVAVGVSQFSDFASGSVLYLTNPNLVCNATRHERWGVETERLLHEITHGEHEAHTGSGSDREHTHSRIDLYGVRLLVDRLRHHYEPLDNESCVAASAIMAEVNASAPNQKQEVGAVLGRVLYHALLGRCFTERRLPNESFFLDYILQHLGSEVFNVTDLEALMKSLHIGPDWHHEHEQDHDHDHDEGEDGHHDHDEDEASHQGDEHVDPKHGVLSRRKTADYDHWRHAENATFDQLCFTAEELVLIYGLAGNGSVLGRSGLARVSPALLQQIVSGACGETAEATAPDGLSLAERYVYASIANAVITLASMLGIALLLCTKCTSVFQLCVHFCISLAVGSLSGDALLHLLPIVLGLHGHSHGTHSHGSHPPPDYIYKMLVVLGGIYLFYLMETLFSLLTYGDKHSSYHGENEPRPCDHGRVVEMFHKERLNERAKSQSTSKSELVVGDQVQPDNEDDEKSPWASATRTREQRMLPYMVVIGDGVHNFADGLAIGAAFALSWRTGLATSMAIFCHELPHELGDFAVLLYCGFSPCKAILFNLGSAMTSFVGLYIALSAATELATTQWIAAVTTGLFLYVALVDMLPAMAHINHKSPWLLFLLQNLGLFVGWTILLLLSLYEESIYF